MSSPTVLDVLKISGDKRMAKKVIKAAEANKKVEEMTAKEENRSRSVKEIRNKLYGSKD